MLDAGYRIPRPPEKKPQITQIDADSPQARLQATLPLGLLTVDNMERPAPLVSGIQNQIF
jgi:hypothetical protein